MPQPVSSNPAPAGRAIVTVVFILVILAPLAYSVVDRVVGGGVDPGEVFLEMPDPRYEACVREAEYMRFHHWELLRGVREEVVRYGIRGEIGLDKCKNCHVEREKFCNRCHDAVSLMPDCFDCHYYP